jgi:uncharacterized membrane protein YfcA
MDSLLLYIATGAAVGFAIGLTGVGGGSLMTPLLLLFGFPPQTAIGTDLLYASITKASGVYLHAKRHNVDWTTVGTLAAGSLPASILTSLLLALLGNQNHDYRPLLTASLGIMLIATASVLLFRRRLHQHASQGTHPALRKLQQHSRTATFLMGIALGVLVTLSSVGAGAFGTAMLLVLYPAFSSIRVVGTDLAHAVPLTLVGGLGHLWLGHVDIELLASLLIGSLPAIYIGTHLGHRLPDKLLHPLLAVTLMLLGIKYAFF